MSTSTLLAVLLACFAAVAFGADAPNLLRNGDFASAANGQPDAWTLSGDPATVTQQLTIEQDPETGRYARLTCTRCDPRTPSSHAMLAQAAILLKKDHTYEFSAQMRATGIRGGVVSVAARNTANWTETGFSSEIAITDRWATYRKVFKATQDTTEQSRLQIWYAEPGTLDLRDVRIAESAEQQVRFTDTVPAGASRNLVRNGSFECSSIGWSSIGKGTGWGNLASLHGTIEQGGSPSLAPDGKSFLRIPLGPGKTPELAFDYYESHVRRELSPLAASLGWIQVEPAKPYTLSCQMRASEAGVPAIVGIAEHNPAGSSWEQRKKVRLTTGWAQYALTFRPRARYVFVTIGPDLPEERAVNVDVDAVQLEQGDKPTEYIAHDPLELGLTTSAKAGIHYAGKPAELLVHLANSADTARDITVQLEARDYFGQTLQLPALKVPVPARTTTIGRVAIPADWRGYYEVAASVPDAKAQATVRLAIVPRRSSRDTVCGINHAFADGDLIPLAEGAGVSWFRDWSLKWQHIEPRPGEWHWEVGDAQINRVLKQNLHVLPLLPPFPSAEWNSEAPASLGTSNYPGIRIRQAWAPQDPQQLANFITAAVNRYKGQISTWEFLNEPLYTDYSLPADSTNKYNARKYSPADYVKLLAVASKAMKAADPNCRVIGGLAGGPMQNMTRELMDAGLLEHIDILNLHMYPGLQAPESFARVMDSELKLMDAHGGRKPIWITEFSYYGTDKLPRDPFMPISWNWAENRLLADERQCADYTVRYFLIMLSHGVERIFIHSGASGTANQTDLECAIFDYGGTPRKLYPALAVLTNLLGPAPRSAGSGKVGDAGKECWYAAFETGTQSIIAYWAAGEAPAKLPTGAGLRWMDTVGRELEAPPAKLSPSPVYLIAPSGQAARLLAELAIR